MNIRAKLTLIMIVLLNIMIIVTGVFVYFKSSQVINNLTTHSALELIDSQNQIISGYIEKEILLLGTLTSDSSVIDLLSDQNNASKISKMNNKLITFTKDKPNLEGIFLANEKGKALSSSNISAVGMDLSIRNYHKKIVSTKAPVISEILVSRFTGNQIFIAARPVFTPMTGKLIGYIANAVTAESMAASLKNMKLNGAESSYAYLVDEKGKMIYHPNAHMIGQSVENREILTALSDMQSGKLSSSTIVQYVQDNQKMISACSLIPETKWMLVIVGNMSEFEAPIRNMNSVIIIVVVLINIFATIIAFFMAKQISKPIIKNLENQNQELSALYEEISASEEELFQQLDEINESKATIVEMAYHDALTHLANRSLLAERLQAFFLTSLQNHTKVAVMFLDLDNFKKVNDTLGHSVGDVLLVETSKRLLNSVRANDLIARLSGDEFSIVITNYKNVEELLPMIKRIMNLFLDPFHIGEVSINMTASVGISVYPDDGSTVEELIRNADTAMYKSKELGKNTYQFFTNSMKAELVQKTNLERMLRNALEKEEFVLHYQPQYCVKTNKLRGFEALVRWNNGELGFMNPMEFIPLAEETGLIIPIGAWVMKTACNICREMMVSDHTSLVMSVNISTIQLKDVDFYDFVMDCVKASGIQPQNLELEITESVFISDNDQSLDILRKLKSAGVRIALDDFGTGYSSLSYLKELPISLLKIDKSFVGETDKNANLTESIISLAHKLNIETIAEGVETKEQLDFLISSGCDNMQGYYFSRPVAEVQMSVFLEKQTSDF